MTSLISNLLAIKNVDIIKAVLWSLYVAVSL